MSKSTTIETNAVEVYDKFLDLTTKEMRKALRSAVTTAASKLRGETRKVFRSVLPAAKSHSTKYNDTLLDAVKRSKVEETKQGEISAKVHIMGSRNTGSGTFRARFFEKGTRPRTTRKGYNRGTIRPLAFFAAANATFQGEYDKILNSEISKAIERINKAKNDLVNTGNNGCLRNPKAD